MHRGRRGLVKLVAALLLAALAVGVFGCGDESESSLTKAEFIKQGNQACQQGNEERVKALEEKQKQFKIESGELATAEQQEKIILAALAGYEKATDKLRELAPAEDSLAEQIIELRDTVAERVRATAATTGTSPVQIRKANLLADKYGLEECVI